MHQQSEIRASIDNDTQPLLQTHDPESLVTPIDHGTSLSTNRNVILKLTPALAFDLDFVAGTIPRARLQTFERILWRVLRGNLYMNHTDIDAPFVDPMSGEETYKNVFIIFTHGESLKSKVRKVAESMGAVIYPVSFWLCAVLEQLLIDKLIFRST